jgi:hypothetical protein
VIGEPSIAYQVTFVIGVLATVNLDDEPPLTANKIDDIRPNGFLPHEFETIQRSRAKVFPQQLLSSGRILAKISC